MVDFAGLHQQPMTSRVYRLSIKSVAQPYQEPPHWALSHGEDSMTLNRFAAFVRMKDLHPSRRPVGGWTHCFEKPFRKESACVLQPSLISPFRWEVEHHDRCSMKQVIQQGEVFVFFQHAIITSFRTKFERKETCHIELTPLAYPGDVRMTCRRAGFREVFSSECDQP